jgi:hypothetical protein
MPFARRRADRHRTDCIGWLRAAVLGANDRSVSIHAQADMEKADLSRERKELEADPAAEQRELTAIYVARGHDLGLGQPLSCNARTSRSEAAAGTGQSTARQHTSAASRAQRTAAPRFVLCW